MTYLIPLGKNEAHNNNYCKNGDDSQLIKLHPRQKGEDFHTIFSNKVLTLFKNKSNKADGGGGGRFCENYY